MALFSYSDFFCFFRKVCLFFSRIRCLLFFYFCSRFTAFRSFNFLFLLAFQFDFSLRDFLLYLNIFSNWCIEIGYRFFSLVCNLLSLLFRLVLACCFYKIITFKPFLFYGRTSFWLDKYASIVADVSVFVNVCLVWILDQYYHQISQ